MLSFEQAREQILQFCHQTDTEKVAVEQGIGRVISEEIRAFRSLPQCHNSAMDGYAIRSVDLVKGPVQLEVIERIYAGDVPKKLLGPKQCARIMTGAQLPANADAVVMQEKVALLSDDRIQIEHPIKANEYVRAKGEDIEEGASIITAGNLLSIGHATALWAQDIQTVRVHQRPSVAIFSSGDELCPLGHWQPGKIVDTNSLAIAAAARMAGANVIELGLVADNLEQLKERITEGLKYDVLISTAGVSVGDRDFVLPALKACDVILDFWKIAIKPGKPVAFGRRNKTAFFALPGNPVSSLVTFDLFVRPYLLKMQGHPNPVPRIEKGILATHFHKPPGLRHFVRVSTEIKDGRHHVTPLANQSSGALSSLKDATYLMSLEPDGIEYAQGTEVDLIPISWGLHQLS